MKKILHIFIVFLLGFVLSGAKSQVLAAQCQAPISGVDTTLAEFPETTSHVVTIDLSVNFDPNKDYWLELEGNTGINQASSVKFRINQNITNACNGGKDCITVKDGLVTWTITSEKALTQDGAQGDIDTKYIDLQMPGVGVNQCDIGTIDIANGNNPGPGCNLKIYQKRGTQQCYQNETQSACFADGQEVFVTVSELKTASGTPWKGDIGLKIGQVGAGIEPDNGTGVYYNGTAATMNFKPNSSNGAKFTIEVEDREWTNEVFPNCKVSLTTTAGCNSNQCEPETELEVGTAPTNVAQEAFSLCKQIPEEQKKQRSACEACTGGSGEFEGNEGVWTAIGCINREPQAILIKFITVGLGMSGGVALLTFLAAGFIFSTSQGDPKAYGIAKEMMTASIVGILFVIFSITILQFIGFEILKIPGFGV